MNIRKKKYDNVKNYIVIHIFSFATTILKYPNFMICPLFINVYKFLGYYHVKNHSFIITLFYTFTEDSADDTYRIAYKKLKILFLKTFLF